MNLTLIFQELILSIKSGIEGRNTGHGDLEGN